MTPTGTPPTAGASNSDQVDSVSQMMPGFTVENLANFIASATDEEERERRSQLVGKLIEETSPTRARATAAARIVDDRVEVLLKERAGHEDDPLYGTLLPAWDEPD